MKYTWSTSHQQGIQLDTLSVHYPTRRAAACMPHVRLQDISETDNVYCPKSDGKIVPPQAYTMLLTTDTGE